MPDPDDSGVRAGEILKARRRGDRDRIQVSRGVMSYDFDEAAAVLAVTLPESSSKFGRRTINRLLRQAAQDGLTGRNALTEADPDMHEHYRKQLVQHGVFTEQAKQDADDRRERARKQQGGDS